MIKKLIFAVLLSSSLLSAQVQIGSGVSIGAGAGSTAYPGVTSDGVDGLDVTGAVSAANITTSITKFGAVIGTGVDNTAALNSAFAWAQANKGCLYIPKGGFRYTSQLTWDSTATLCLKGESSTQSYLYYDGGSISGAGLEVHATGNYTQVDLRDVGFAASTNAQYALRLKTVGSSNIDTVDLAGGSVSSLQCEDCNLQGDVRNLRVAPIAYFNPPVGASCVNGLTFTTDGTFGSGQFSMENPTVEYCSGIGLNLANAGNIVINGGQISGNGQQFYEGASSSNITLDNVLLESPGPANITNFSITSNVVTITAANSYAAGNTVTVYGMSTGTYLNGQTLTVLASGLSGSQYKANFTHADVGSTADSGQSAKGVPSQIYGPRNTFVELYSAWMPLFIYSNNNTFLGGGVINPYVQSGAAANVFINTNMWADASDAGTATSGWGNLNLQSGATHARFNDLKNIQAAHFLQGADFLNSALSVSSSGGVPLISTPLGTLKLSADGGASVIYIDAIDFDASNNYVKSNVGYKVGSNIVLPSTVTGYHGSSGTKVQLSDGTGTSGNCVKYAADGSLTDAGAACGTGGSGMVYPSGSGIPVVASGASWGTTLAAPTGALIGAGQANTYTTGLQDFSSATVKLPSSVTVGANSITMPASAGTLALTSAIPSVGTWGALNYPTWSSGSPLVKMTAAGTFGLDATAYQTALTNPVTGPASPTAGYLTKWGASGDAIVDGLKLGTMTDSDWCTYTTANGIQCTSATPGGSGTVTVVSSGSLTSTALVTGGGTTTLQTPSATTTLDSSGNLSLAGSLTTAGSVHGVNIPAGTAATGAAGHVIYASDATNGYAEVNENNTGLSRVCTAANGICGAGSGTVTSSGSPAIHQVAVFTTGTDIKGVAVGATDKPLVGVTSGDPAFSKLTLTNPATAATLTIADGKTATVNNTLTFSGTDSSTLNVGTGGTLGTAAYTASSAYDASGAAAARAAVQTCTANKVLAAIDTAATAGNCITLANANLPTGTGSTNVLVGGVITGAGPTGGATSIPVITYNAGGQLTTVTTATPTVATVQGGTTGQMLYQSAANTSAFLSPGAWTTGHTFVPVWQPSGSALAPVTVDANTLTVSAAATAANLSGTPAVPNGTTATTQADLSNDTKLATDAYADGPRMLTSSGMTAMHAYYVSAANTLTEAGGALTATTPAVCVAASATVCVIRGMITTSGLTAGAPYYVPTTAAVLTSTAPSTAGQFIQRLGVAYSTTVFIVNPSVDVYGL